MKKEVQDKKKKKDKKEPKKEVKQKESTPKRQTIEQQQKAKKKSDDWKSYRVKRKTESIQTNLKKLTEISAKAKSNEMNALINMIKKAISAFLHPENKGKLNLNFASFYDQIERNKKISEKHKQETIQHIKKLEREVKELRGDFVQIPFTIIDLTTDYAFNFNPAEIKLLLDAIEIYMREYDLENVDPYLRDVMYNILGQINDKSTGLFEEKEEQAMQLIAELQELGADPEHFLKHKSGGKYGGKGGWYGESERHSRARATGKADMVYDFLPLSEFKNITKDFQFPNGDFTVLEGPITRAGPFPYELGGQKVTLYKQWDNLKDIFSQLDYIPLIGSREIGAHEAENLGFAYNFRFDEGKERVLADIITFEDMEVLSGDYTPDKEGWEVSIGFKDYRMGNKQLIDKVDHLAVSLLNKEIGRCRAGGDPCFISRKNTHDQNLTEVVS